MPNDRQKQTRSASLQSPASQSKGFRAYREARRHVIAEDYIELISDLLAEGNEARQVDIAARMGVAQPTVAKVLSRLVDEGLITRRPYRGVFLTQAGEELAHTTRERHRLIHQFLEALGVSADTVAIDAEGIEHYISDETLRAFSRALKGGLGTFMKNLP